MNENQNQNPDMYYMEIDGERPHEAEFLAEWLKPEVTIWVSIGTSHAVQFEKLVKEGKFSDVSEAIAAEFLPRLRERLTQARSAKGLPPVELRLDARAAAIIPGKAAGFRIISEAKSAEAASELCERAREMLQ